jgi:hypothetical protein
MASPIRIEKNVCGCFFFGIGAGRCGSTASAWAISVPLKTAPTTSWCVDSTGASKSQTGAITGTACL